MSARTRHRWPRGLRYVRPTMARLAIGSTLVPRQRLGAQLRVAQIWRKDRQVLLVDERGARQTVALAELRTGYRIEVRA